MGNSQDIILQSAEVKQIDDKIEELNSFIVKLLYNDENRSNYARITAIRDAIGELIKKRNKLTSQSSYVTGGFEMDWNLIFLVLVICVLICLIYCVYPNYDNYYYEKNYSRLYNYE